MESPTQGIYSCPQVLYKYPHEVADAAGGEAAERPEQYPRQGGDDDGDGKLNVEQPKFQPHIRDHGEGRHYGDVGEPVSPCDLRKEQIGKNQSV